MLCKPVNAVMTQIIQKMVAEDRVNTYFLSEGHCNVEHNHVKALNVLFITDAFKDLSPLPHSPDESNDF